MPVLSITSLTLEELFSYFLMVLILVFASGSVISKNISNSILWFGSAAIAVFALLADGDTSIVSIVCMIACISLVSALFFLESCYNISNNKRQQYSKSAIYTCICTAIISLLLFTIKFSHNVINIKNKHYDSTMYLITTLFSITFLITIFGFRVFHDKKI